MFRPFIKAIGHGSACGQNVLPWHFVYLRSARRRLCTKGQAQIPASPTAVYRVLAHALGAFDASEWVVSLTAEPSAANCRQSTVTRDNADDYALNGYACDWLPFAFARSTVANKTMRPLRAGHQARWKITSQSPEAILPSATSSDEPSYRHKCAHPLASVARKFDALDIELTPRPSRAENQTAKWIYTNKGGRTQNHFDG